MFNECLEFPSCWGWRCFAATVIWPERLLHIRVAMGSVDIFRQHPPFPTPHPPPSLSFALSRRCGWSRRCCCCCRRNSCCSLNLLKHDYPCYLCICYCYPWRTECCSIAGIGYEFRPISTKVVQGPSSGPPVCSEPCPIASVEPSIGEVLQGPRYICIYICMYIYMFT